MIKHHLPMSEYLAHPGISKTAVQYIRISPEAYKQWRDGLIEDEESPALLTGRIVHALILERKRDFVVRPDDYQNEDGETKPWNYRSKICKEWRAAQNKPDVTKLEALEYIRWQYAVLGDSLARSLLDSGEAEVSMFATDPDTGIPLKARPDWTGSDYFLDLKTTTDASTEAFSREIFKRLYHIQAACTLRVAKLLGLPQTKWFFIALEKSNPPRINVRQLDEKAIQLGNAQLDEALKLIKECQDSGNWYGYSGKSGEIEAIDVPAYAHAKSDNELFSKLCLAGEKMFQD
jgi:hypothetical protein